MASNRLLTLVSLIALGCDGGAGASLQPIAAQTVRVNETLTLTIAIDNPAGRPVEVTLEPLELPMFDRVSRLSTEPGGAVFRWSPLSSHTGTHELTFVLRDTGGSELDRETALIEVLASAESAPVFVRPGAGGTFDIERDPCVRFDVEVRDDDTPDVEIGVTGELPERATFASGGPRRAAFDWCPTPDQVAASERWTIQLYADDGEHPRVLHEYIIVLRSGPKEGCPGAAPTISITTPAMGEVVTSGTTYPVQVTVRDDMGLRDAPLLYYSTTSPSDPRNPDVTEFEQVGFEAGGEAGRYVARIPNLGLEVGAMREVWFLVSVTDNDDPSGSLCDHRTDSPVVSFFAVGGVPPDATLAACELCTASTECASGICASAPAGARCVEACVDTTCSSGSCGATVTTEGGARAGCGPVSEVCGGGGVTCTDDAREDDDTAATATTYVAPITDGQICAMDDDFFAIAVGAGERLTVTVDGFMHSAGDLDLELRAPDGTILATSASVRDMEQVSYCNGAAMRTMTARVFGFESDQNSYSFRADAAPDPGGCCVDDASEDDDTRVAARTIAFVSDVGAADGRLCPRDDDWVEIPMSGAGTIDVFLVFSHADGDIDIALYDPAGTRIAAAVSTTDDETLSVDVAGGGTYTLRIYGIALRGVVEYAGEITRTLGSMCAVTRDCPLDTVCDAGMCRADACASIADCPPMHGCPNAGPVPAGSRCGAACSVNADCRSSEACKWFAEGRFCARRGSGQNGDGCASFAQCGGQRACVDWAGGYCARAGCTDNGSCESGTYCVTEGALDLCALSCVSNPCRDAEGYTCDFRPTLGGTSRFVCVPR